jgi:hypothetical protein
MQHARWFHIPAQAWLGRQVHTLRGCALACECPPSQPCHGEVFATAAALKSDSPASAAANLVATPDLSGPAAGTTRAPKKKGRFTALQRRAALLPAGSSVSNLPQRGLVDGLKGFQAASVAISSRTVLLSSQWSETF